MVVRRAKLENLSKNELIDRLLQVEKIYVNCGFTLNAITQSC